MFKSAGVVFVAWSMLLSFSGCGGVQGERGSSLSLEEGSGEKDPSLGGESAKNVNIEDVILTKSSVDKGIDLSIRLNFLEPNVEPRVVIERSEDLGNQFQEITSSVAKSEVFEFKDQELSAGFYMYRVKVYFGTDQVQMHDTHVIELEDEVTPPDTTQPSVEHLPPIVTYEIMGDQVRLSMEPANDNDKSSFESFTVYRWFKNRIQDSYPTGTGFETVQDEYTQFSIADSNLEDGYYKYQVKIIFKNGSTKATTISDLHINQEPPVATPEPGVEIEVSGRMGLPAVVVTVNFERPKTAESSIAFKEFELQVFENNAFSTNSYLVSGTSFTFSEPILRGTILKIRVRAVFDKVEGGRSYTKYSEWVTLEKEL